MAASNSVFGRTPRLGILVGLEQDHETASASPLLMLDNDHHETPKRSAAMPKRGEKKV